MARYKVGLETRDKILDATRALLAEGGLDGTTIAAICERAGIRPGSFYNLFDSKEQAVLTVVGEAIDAVDPDPSGGGSDTVAELFQAYVQFITGQPALARVYVQMSVAGGLDPGELGQRILAHHERRVDRFAAALAREHSEMTEPEARLDAEVMLATLNGLAFLWLLDPSIDFGGHAARVLSERLPAR